MVAGFGSDSLDGEEGGDTYRITGRGGLTTELTTAFDSGMGVNDIDQLIFVGTAFADTVLLRAMGDSYFPVLADKLLPLIERFFNGTLSDRLAGMLQAIEDAYGPHDLPPGLRQALTDEYQ